MYWEHTQFAAISNFSLDLFNYRHSLYSQVLDEN